MAGIVVTGFGPFGEWARNSSGEAVRLLAGVSAHVLPVDHALAADCLREIVAAERPGVLLLTGLARSRYFRLETVARGQSVRAGRWDFAAARARLMARGEPCRLSANAGRYVCETTYFAALGTPVPRVAFLHVPPLGGAWSVERVARGIVSVLGAG